MENKLPGLKIGFDNLDMDLDTFRKTGYEVIDRIAAYYATIRDRDIISKNNSRQIEELFRQELPVEAQQVKDIIAEWDELILPNATHLGSPRYFGFVNGSGTMISVFADALATSVNMNTGGWKAGPSATEIERRSIAWIAELIGYSTTCGGLFLGGGTVANFAALSAALKNYAGYNIGDEGLQSEKIKGKFTVYMSDHEGHISIVKAVDMLNLGRNCIRRVPSHADLTMNATALAEMIEQDIEEGKLPLCVIAQVGSINVGVVDPMEEIAEICEARSIWFHGDGACGAVGAMLPELTHLYKGLEKADSITLDPHKWLYIPYECGCLLVKDAKKLQKTFSIAAPYLQGSLPTDYKGLDYFEYGPQMSRGFNALKVWMSLKFYGKSGYQQLLRQNILCAKHLHNLVNASPDFLPMHDPQLFIYSFRYYPAQLRNAIKTPALESYLDGMNQKITDAIMATGFAFIMTSKIKGHVVIRLSICSHRTTLEDMDAVFSKLRELASGLFKQEPFA